MICHSINKMVYRSALLIDYYIMTKKYLQGCFMVNKFYLNRNSEKKLCNYFYILFLFLFCKQMWEAHLRVRYYSLFSQVCLPLQVHKDILPIVLHISLLLHSYKCTCVMWGLITFNVYWHAHRRVENISQAIRILFMLKRLKSKAFHAKSYMRAH